MAFIRGMAFLMTSQKAQLYEILVHNGFDPMDFEMRDQMENRSRMPGEIVAHKRSDYYFWVFRNSSDYSSSGPFIAEYSPGSQMLKEATECYDWHHVCVVFAQSFLHYFNREIKTINPWETAKAFANKVHLLPKYANDDAPISSEEREAIWKALGAIQATLLEHVGKSAEKADFIVSQIQLLKDASEKFGKKDYLMLLYSALIGITTTVSVPPETGMLILATLNAVFSKIAHLT
ncbi:MAG: hypothetical protein QM796_11090 [Chthoniobacteraceae bacterium]